MYEKTIVCLAASKRPGGTCIAGKEYNNGRFGDWIRPVSNRANRGLQDPERRTTANRCTEVLDVITVPLNMANREGHQTENHIIEDGEVWTHHARLTKENITDAIDDVTGLWQNGHSSGSGENDRVPVADLQNEQSSLALIEPENLILHVDRPNRPNPRATFNFQGSQYNLAMTDPLIKRAHPGNGCHSLPNALICVSLAEPLGIYAYKLIASIIR